jgi:16S rRNA processing protein RimM
VKIHSFTQPETNILDYSPWFVSVKEKLLSLTGCKKQGNFLIGLIEDYNTPEKAKTIVNSPVMILKSQLPQLDSHHTQEYYWTDLMGLDVYNLKKTYLGKIDSIFNTGANDILVIINIHQNNKKTLIPYVFDRYIKSIDLDEKKMIIDWHEDWL